MGNAGLIEALRSIVGDRGLLLGDDVQQRPNASWGKGSCPAIAIVRPASTDELSEVVKLCHAHNQTIVPWGGLTGLVDGITASEQDVVISMERMNAIEAIDAEAGIMVVQSGAILENVQNAAREAGWQFCVDLGGRGSANIGGVISTNAGGNSVIRYGMMREQVLGLEAVMADGTVISSMNRMLKNNAGYDLKQLFIGTEGTLGLVSRAVLRMRPSTPAVQTAFLGVDDFDSVVKVLGKLNVQLDGRLSAFEVMWNGHYRLMIEDVGGHQRFLGMDHAFYLLVESSGSHAEDAMTQFTAALEELMEDGAIADAVIAQSSAQAEALWHLRDDVGSLSAVLSPVAIFDISLPIRTMLGYIDRLSVRLGQRFPEAKMSVFGHLADGNLHLNFGPVSEEQRHEVDEIVYDELSSVNGSISAEHGIGLEKKPYLHCSRSDEEIALMKLLKSSLDPKGILNPGKVF